MIHLPNGCRCSKLSVYPKNWESKNARITIHWHIMYRYYDPRYEKPKQVILKGMNTYKSISERQNATKSAITSEMDKLLYQGYNPFIKASYIPNASGIINPNTPILEALLTINTKLEVSEKTKIDLKHVLIKTQKAIKILNLEHFPISQVSRKTIKMILESASKSSDSFNKNRSYLMILFSELCEWEVVETNPLRDIKKKKIIKHIREVLSDDERILVNNHLHDNYPEFHRFVHIFFHSGARISELLRIKKKDVDLKNQRYKMLIQKGREHREVWKTIKDLALPYWIEIMRPGVSENYLFSVGLNPGTIQIQPYQITKRWYRLVKKKLGIKADFYSLKHLHTTEVVDLLNENEAAKHNEHTSTSMVNTIYDVRKADRNHSHVKGLKNKFA